MAQHAGTGQSTNKGYTPKHSKAQQKADDKLAQKNAAMLRGDHANGIRLLARGDW